MKTIAFLLFVLWGHSVSATTPFIPTEFLPEGHLKTTAHRSSTSEEFSENIEHLLAVQQLSLEKVAVDHPKVRLTQVVTSFSASKSGLFGLSTLSSSSATTLFWNRRNTERKSVEVPSFEISAAEDDLSLQMKIDDLTDFLVKQDKIKDAEALRSSLDRIIRRSHGIFRSLDQLETQNWKVGGYRLDLSVSASGVVTPFTKVSENVRLWLEWTKAPRLSSIPEQEPAPVTRFMSKVLEDTEAATARVTVPNFELQNMFIGLGEDVKTGLFGFGSVSTGFVGYVKLVRKPGPTMAVPELIEPEEEASYTVVQTPGKGRSNGYLRMISRKKLRRGIERSLKFASFFSKRSERLDTLNWELSSIRETATVTSSGAFGLSTLSTRGVFIFTFNRKSPPPSAPAVLSSVLTGPGLTRLDLIRLSFVTVLGYAVPQIANFELRPNVEFFWR